MSLITNQWIDRGVGLRNRGYSPVEVKLEYFPPTTKFDRDNGVFLTLNARRRGGDLQVLHLREDEVVAQFDACADRLSESARLLIVAKALALLNDENTLKVLDAAFAIRRARKKKAAAPKP
jgi:hypothetical protein